MIRAKAAPAAVISELNLEFQLISLDRLATYYARLADPGPAPRAVRLSRWQRPNSNRLSGLRSKNWFVAHRQTPTSNSIAFDDRLSSVTIGNSGIMFAPDPTDSR